jgi:hypothetical protein
VTNVFAEPPRRIGPDEDISIDYDHRRHSGA